MLCVLSALPGHYFVMHGSPMAGKKPVKSTEWTRVVFGLAPSQPEVKRMVWRLWRRYGRDGLADLLGVPVATLEDWAYNGREPSCAARKLVWLVWCLEFHPERCRTAFDVTTWGRFRR